VPLTDKTRNILSRENLAKTKKGVRIINCARGGLIDEAALAGRAESGHVAGAALDVFEVEPATESPLFNHPNVVCTPHLGASTTEAQENVALQVAEQMSDLPADRGRAERAEHAQCHRRRGRGHGAVDQACRAIWAPSSAR
jgi:D-3-phosphoglycerate dehydrogenase